MAAGELGVLLNGRRSYGNWKETVPNRSGSAPPSMEGSLSALGNLIGQQNSTFESSLGNLRDAARSCEPEEQLSADPAFSSYYWSTVNLNPQLPSPLISQENCCLVGRIGRLGENRRVPSFDDSGKGSLFVSQPTLSTHKEEPEDDRSPKLASSECTDQNSPLVFGQFISSSEGHNKSLVDLIQVDFPRTSSPVYNNQSHPSDQKSTDKAAVDAGVNHLHDSSTNMCRSSDFNMTAGDVQSSTLTPGVNLISLIPTSDPSAVPIPSSSCSDRKMNRHPRPQEDSRSMSANSDNGIVSGVAISKISNVDSEMKTLKITGHGHGSQCAEQHPHSTSLCPQGSSVQQGSQSQMILQGTHISYNAMDNFSQGQSNLSSVEIQPVLHSTGFMPPFQTPAAPFGTPLCTNMQPSNFFIPQYGIGGYFLDTSFMPPVIAGYSPHSAIPMPPNSAIPMPSNCPVSPNFNGKTSGATAIANVTPEAEFMQLQKIYGQLGLAMQTSIPDPMNVQYVQHPSFNSFVGGNQFDPMASRGSIVGHLADSCDQQKVLSVAYSPVRRPQFLQHGGASFPSLRKSGTASPNYHGSPSYMEAFMSYPTSPLSTTLSPGSPWRNLSQRGNDNTRLPLTPRRNRNTSSGWQGQRGHEKVDDLKLHSVLEELKSNKAHRYELSDVAGHIVKFSADQHGSRFIQQKLENCSVEERASVFGEIIPHASTLMTNVFGNYVIQKFFEHGSPEQRRELADQLAGHILSLSLQMYGCRVIQKAFEVIELDQKTQLVLELDGHVLQCVHDQNGNHVIQKCIECLPTDKIGFIISAFRGQVATLSMHPYGCRVIQRVLEHCTDELQSQCIVDEILQSTCILAQDQYGNYVTQHVLERRKPHEMHQITTKLAGQIVRMSQNKYASNVIEKCLEYGDAAERELLMEEIAGQTDGSDNLLTMMKDQFANYVVQKILETCTEKQRDTFLDRIRVHLQTLKKYNYGKHIVARIERLCSEGTHNSINLK